MEKNMKPCSAPAAAIAHTLGSAEPERMSCTDERQTKRRVCFSSPAVERPP